MLKADEFTHIITVINVVDFVDTAENQTRRRVVFRWVRGLHNWTATLGGQRYRPKFIGRVSPPSEDYLSVALDVHSVFIETD